ncbi:MAG: hypothetical protein ABI367_09310 [Mucilaginibacter sp.]
MVKRILVITIIMGLGIAVQYASAQTIAPKNKQLRHQLLQAVNSSKTTDSLYSSLNATPNKSPLLVGYMATLQALQAKHTWNPYTKIKQISNAEKTFGKAIAADPHSLELRFMRFSVEYHLPGFLGLSKNMEADKQEIFLQLNNKQQVIADRDLVVGVINFLLETNTHTAAEKIDLNKQLASLQ